MKEIVLAGGCFWGVEKFLASIKGVEETKVGYANGSKENPTYQQVCAGDTGHAESCYVKYNEQSIELKEVLSNFWSIIDPTVLNRQGNDIGNEYRTGIFYIEQEDLPIILKSKDEEQNKYKSVIVTEIKPLKCFYAAEEYHQKYLKKNPNGYCHIKF